MLKASKCVDMLKKMVFKNLRNQKRIGRRAHAPNPHHGIFLSFAAKYETLMDSYKTLVRNLKVPYFLANLYWDRAKLKKVSRFLKTIFFNMSTHLEALSIYETFSMVPLRAPAIHIYPYARWEQNGLTVAGGNGQGNGSNQLYKPSGLFVDHDHTMYVADYWNHRIMEWKQNAASGRVVAGGNGEGNANDQLAYPTDVILDKETNSLIICDAGNDRVVRWPRRNGKTGETIISNINCEALTMDKNGSLYVGDDRKAKVIRYRRGEFEGTVVAGGNGKGNSLNQVSGVGYVFVDQDRSVYVSEWGNNRVTKWMVGAEQGVIVAGGLGEGNSLTQLSTPRGVVVDSSGTVYVADQENNRIMRWMKGATKGTVIVGGDGMGAQPNQFLWPIGLAFDLQGNLYVADHNNARVEKFNINQFGKFYINESQLN
ncbi:unnamed protein product [Adineta ricciae]|uniref:Uncharacterized protein n=1 Tax=Adineta ricciae TaxID=249248 RepID=A0A814TA91_ADIRI|nr:unnamed protein product [Adineta ricciae]